MADNDNPTPPEGEPNPAKKGADKGAEKGPEDIVNEALEKAAEDAAGEENASAEETAQSGEETAQSDEEAGAAAATDATADAELSAAELLVALEAARAAGSQSQDQALRAKAEMENLRRRTTRDVENAHKFALEKFTKALIPVFESLEKAEASKGDATDAESAAAVLEGVSLSLKLFKDTLEKQGVTQIDPHGEPFDPAFHEAVAMVPMPDSEPNSVIEVIRKGFDLNGRLVQAAQVVVSQAPPEG